MSDNKELQDLDLKTLSKEELITKIEKLTQSNSRLRSQIHNLTHNATGYRKPNQRSFAFNGCCMQKIALKIAYIGWEYQGFASQDNTDKTIEHEIFAALTKTCLIEDRASCEYSRCGRTDKGVSAFGQVISLKVRAGKKTGNQDQGGALDYVKILNRVLPPEIRILAWTDVPEEFNARFSCQTRTYKYFFPAAGLDIQAMNIAAKKLIGEHDFRNFCKVDVGNNVNHFIRRINSFEVQGMTYVNRLSTDGDMCEVTICGMAFLWHQVRCMVSVLFLIGLHLEQPEVIDELFDVTRYPKKPQYSMVSEIPLILFDCAFQKINWMYPPEQHAFVVSQFEQMWTSHAVRTSMIGKILGQLQLSAAASGNSEGLIFPLMPGHRKTNYVSLLSRPVCDGIDRHLEKQAVKRKKLEERCKAKKKKSEHMDTSNVVGDEPSH